MGDLLDKAREDIGWALEAMDEDRPRRAAMLLRMAAVSLDAIAVEDKDAPVGAGGGE